MTGRVLICLTGHAENLVEPAGALPEPGDRASPTSGSGIRTVDVLFADGEH
jgi:hypothetical protein